MEVTIEAVNRPTFGLQQTESLMDAPSRQFETAICSQLNELLVSSQQNSSRPYVEVLCRSVIFMEQFAVVISTGGVLLASCVVSRPQPTVLVAAGLFLLVYIPLIVFRGYGFWSRVTEAKMRTVSVMKHVLDRWTHRTVMMATWSVQTPAQRRLVFLEAFAHIPLKAFRIVSVVDDRTYRLKHIHKSITVKNASRLDEAELRSFKYREPKGICKLVDVMKITLEGEAILLKTLLDRAPPPRWSTLEMSRKNFVEEEATTDESDEETDARTALGSGNSISVSGHMEFFIHRMLLILWCACWAPLLLVGVIQVLLGAPLGRTVFLIPATTLLGLLPVNTFVLHYSLTLVANVHLDKLFHYLVTKSSHRDDDALPQFSTIATIQTAIRVFFLRQPSSGGRNPLVLSSSLVDTFGMASAIAVLDQTGIVTDMVLVPRRVLLMHPAVENDEESSSDEDSVIGCLTAECEREALKRRRQMRNQIKRQKFREQRFVELPLRTSAREDQAVEFDSREELKKHQPHLSPMCLCILLHALIKEPTNLSLWTEPFRLCDRSQRWARALHWLPRACGDDDAVIKKFTVVARIFQIDTAMRSSFRSSYPEQASSLLVKSKADGALHLFTMGTPHMVATYCTSHWTGDTVSVLDVEEKTEITVLAKQQWEQGSCYETVALSHRLLPQRYQKYVSSLPRSKGKYNEYFFCDGVEVTGPVPLRQRQSGTSTVKSRRSLCSDTQCHSGREGTGFHRRTSSFRTLSRTTADYPFPKRSSSVGAHPSEQHGPLEKDDSLTLKTFMHLMITSSHTFLGLAGLQDSVRPNVQSATTKLNGAGVRCMYFCSENERQTRSFGSRIGLETEWNSCISLKKEAVTLDDRSIRAQLPFGINSIRKHLLHVDPIPLHVNLFSHAHGVATRAMLSVLQDNHQTVIAIGSVFNHGNVRSFVQADLAVGVLPTRRGLTAEKEEVLKHSRIVEPSDFSLKDATNPDQPLYRNVAELIGCNCALRSPPTPSLLPIMVTMIREARGLLCSISNSTEFALHSNLFISAVSFVSVMLGLPLLSPAMIVLELSFVVPVLSLCCSHSASSPGADLMRNMPSRHNYFVRVAILRHSSLVWCLRYLPSLLCLAVLGFTAMTSSCQCSIGWGYTDVFRSCAAEVHGYVALTMNYWLLVHCWTHISRHHSIIQFFAACGRSPLPVSWWVLLLSVVSQVLSFVLVWVSLLGTPGTSFADAIAPSLVHVVASATFPILLLAFDIPLKRWRAKRFDNMQKFRRVTFGTRLGMHSPRGDYEPEGETVVSSEEVPPTSSTRVTFSKRLKELIFRLTCVHQGKLERNCVCCDHIGGNYATYHVSLNA